MMQGGGMHIKALGWNSSRVGVVVMVVVVMMVNVPYSCGLPLSTQSRWIVDEATGGRVKLACVNWAAHLEPMLAEGLDKRPVDCIAGQVAKWGFNCVRLTWATYMYTNATLSNRTLGDTLAALGLQGAMAGIARHNPSFLALRPPEALAAVAAALGARGLMVVLDNQISAPGWCCAERDGSGFFGDREFDPEVWLRGLRAVAAASRDIPAVVAMSLRNELRGRAQNAADWYRYMQMGAEAIHQENPNLLVIHGGLSYAQNLKFLASRPLNETLQNKIVYEVHRYSFTNGDSYMDDLDHKCAAIMQQIMGASGFVTTPNQSFTGPLFVSEFGVDQSGARANDDRFLPCFSAFLAHEDFDWAYWALQGSYYLRQGKVDADETYGLMNHAWNAPRNSSILRRLQALQSPFIQDIDPDASSELHQVIFHPSTGLCINAISTSALTLGSCNLQSTWRLNSKGKITLDGTQLVISAQGEGLEAMLKVSQEEEETSIWKNTFTFTHMQFSTQAGNETLCLDGNSPPTIYTRTCICISHKQCGIDLVSQWFKLIDFNALHSTKSFASL